jgi:hypothetical protein
MRWHRRRRVTQRLRGNLHQPFGLQAAHGHLLRPRSPAMLRIACLTMARMCPRGTCNAGPDFTNAGH